jgi:DNA-binding beta-propeller fold protein YncE
MDETRLVRDLLERATIPEPPIGPMAQNALRGGIRRRRRRAQRTAAGAAAAAVVCAVALAVTGAIGHRAAAPAGGPATVYVLGGGGTIGTVTPISASTNRAGRPIVVRTGSGIVSGQALAVTPDGKTIWAAGGAADVTPISTATNKPGKPVRVAYGRGGGPDQVLVTPDGKTVYVLDLTGAVIPISAATHRRGKPVGLGQNLFEGGEMAITPDGKTLYVAMFAPPGKGPSYVFAIATATDRVSKRISVPTAATAIVVTPDGKTLYVIGQPLAPPGMGPPARDQKIEVTPIATATNRAGKPIIVGRGAVFSVTPVAITPDGQTLYIPDSTPNGVIPFSTVTNTSGRLISFGGASIERIAVTPDGSTAYVLSQPPGKVHIAPVPGNGGALACTGPAGEVTPIATATNTPGTPVKVGCIPLAVAITPDGRTMYVSSEAGTVTPVATATDQTAKPVMIESPQEIVIAPGPR